LIIVFILTYYHYLFILCYPVPPAAARLSRTTLKSEPTVHAAVVPIRPLAPLTRLGNDGRAVTPLVQQRGVIFIFNLLFFSEIRPIFA
jgi:hypothetical protein